MQDVLKLLKDIFVIKEISILVLLKFLCANLDSSQCKNKNSEVRNIINKK